jgi:hypothetical protein
MKRRKLYLALFAWLLSACATIPNTRQCTVAGTLGAGMICAYTLSDQTEEMGFDASLGFLEPTEERGGAICQSAEDFSRQKTALEQACKRLGSFCKKEVRTELSRASSRMARLLDLQREMYLRQER